MRYLSIIILALVANIAQAQQVNPVTDYTFANRMSSGRSTVTDTAAYFSIGPRYGAVRGMMPPMVTDTVSMSANKRNGLLIFSIQKNKYQVWDSAGAKWADITGTAGSAIISADTAAMLLPYLRKADTTAMLLPYLRKSDTVWLSNRINLKLNISDTSSMLNPYLRGSGTANYFPKFDALRSVINSKLYESGTNLLFNTTNPSFTSAGITTIENNATSSAVYTYKIADTIRAYMGYGGSSTFDINNLRAGDIRFYTSATLRGRFQTDGTFRLNSLTGTGSRIVTADADGVLSATSSATGLVDTTVLSTRSWRQKGIDSVNANVALKVNISDTSSMLTNYIRHAGNGLTKSGQALSVDTAAIATRARVQKGIDSVATLATAGVTSVATGYGLSGGTITTTGTIIADSAIVASRLRVGKVVDSLALVKQNVLTNPVTGTGTTNYVPKFTGTSTIGNSLIYDNGSEILINTTTDAGAYALQAEGGFWQVGNALLGLGKNKVGIQRVPVYTFDVKQEDFVNNVPQIVARVMADNGSTSPGPLVLNQTFRTSATANNQQVRLEAADNDAFRDLVLRTDEVLINDTIDQGAYTLQIAGNLYTTTGGVLAASSGNVGIGTTSPQFKGHIKQDKNVNGLVIEMANRNAANDYAQIGFSFDPFPTTITSAIRSVYENPFSTFNTSLAFLTYSGSLAERGRFNPSGELLINTTTDAGDYKLQVSGNAYVTGTTVLAATSGSVQVGATLSPWTWKAVQVGTAALSSTSTVGFVSANAYFDGSYKYVSTGAAQVLEVNNGNEFRFLSAASGTGGNAISFTQAMTLTASGELLVGTTTDAGTFRLQVGGSIYNTGTYTSAAPTDGTAAPWRLGSYVTTAPTATGFVQVEINGVKYKLLAATY
jgi:hypothetical protein